ncbi:type II secretion system F family protein [Candidatus Woesearchaeota archaeon]|nr:type II secretion system F family protein [Nanoarchaeota archaeon]MCB9369997.1 type II secretion system F family protein [Candidatus Woesearchaeota archaeon]USN44532.1 MAG: type II secretion system F family protein [Candidatus Woesearchaeota archaeon]
MAEKKSPHEEKSLLDASTAELITMYFHFIYRSMGRNLLLREKFRNFFFKNIYNKRFEKILIKANMKTLPEEYFIGVYITMTGAIALLAILTITLLLAFGSETAVYFFYGAFFLTCLLGFFIYNFPVILANQRRQEIDAAMPYILPYMKILAKELPLSKIITILDEFLIYKAIKEEFQKIRYYSEFLGYDIQTSVREAMFSCPSKLLSDLMNDLVTISNSGGDVYGYLERKLNNLEQEIESLEKKNIETLLIYSQVYVVVLLIAPLFFAIMSSILNLIDINVGSSSQTSDPTSTITTLVILLLALPFAYVGFMMLVYYSKPLYARLKPMKNESKI